MRPSSLLLSPQKAKCTPHSRVILFCCDYETKWSDTTRAIYAGLNHYSESTALAQALHVDEARVLRAFSLFGLIGLVDLSSCSFDSCVIRKGIDLLLHQKDDFLFFFYRALGVDPTYVQKQRLVSFLHFVAYGGTTTEPFFAILQDYGRLYGLIDYDKIITAFAASFTILFPQWWQDNGQAWNESYEMLVDVLLAASLGE